MDNGIRERAQRLAESIAGYFCGGACDEEIADVCSDIARFASTEADRRERECIKAQCKWCGRSVAVDRRVFGDGDKFFYWGHELGDDGDVVMCRSGEIHELRYQREQGGK